MHVEKRAAAFASEAPASAALPTTSSQRQALRLITSRILIAMTQHTAAINVQINS